MTLPTASLRARRRAAGHCLWCSAAAEPGRTLCATHAEYHRQRRRAERRAITNARKETRV